MPEAKQMVVGMKGLRADTPQAIKWIYRSVAMLAAIWVLVVGAFPEIPMNIQLNTLKVLSLGGSIIYTICQFCGYAETDKDNGSTTT